MCLLSLDWKGDIVIPDTYKKRLRVFPHSRGLPPSIGRLYEPSGVQKLDVDLRNLCLNASTLKPDVSFTVEGITIHGHSCILMNRSDYFKAMFSGFWKERIGGNVTIEETSPEAFQAVILYLYTGNTNVVTDDVVLDLLGLADQYLVGDLYRYCVHFMESNLGNGNAVEWFLWSHCNSRDGLRETCKKYLVENYDAIKEEYPETVDQITNGDLLVELSDAVASLVPL